MAWTSDALSGDFPLQPSRAFPNLPGRNWMDAEAGKAEELGLGDEDWQRRFDDEAGTQGIGLRETRLKAAGARCKNLLWTVRLEVY